MKRLIYFLICALFMALAGCESAPISSGFLLAPLEGKIFDYDNVPCSDVLVTVDNGGGVRTDINGRFVIPALGKGKHTIKASKENYEENTQEVNFINRNQVLWIRIISINQLEKKIEKAFEARKWDELESLIDRALAIKGDDPVILYIQALYFNQNGWVEQAMDVLGKILEAGHNEPAVFIAMADICEYKLKDKARAIEYLQKYLEQKTDEAAVKRLDALRKSQ